MRRDRQHPAVATLLWSSAIVASLKVAAAVIGTLSGGTPRVARAEDFPLLFLLELGVYTGAAGVMLLGGARDRRAIHLGIVFLLSASAFADGLIPRALEQPASLKDSLDLLFSIKLFSLQPMFLWLFVRDFPRAPESRRLVRWIRVTFVVSMWVGVGLLVVNLVRSLGWRPESGAIEATLRLLSYSERGIYWPLVYLLVLPALPVIVWRTRTAPLIERRRVAVFGWGLAIGVGVPLGVGMLQQSSVAVQEYLSVPWRRDVQLAIGYAFLALTPVAATYSVVVHRVLDVRLIVRKAIQYALARFSVIGLTALPFLMLTGLLYERRNEPFTLVSLVASSWVWFVTGAIGIVALAYRLPRKALMLIDRQFFREQYDASRILATLAELPRTLDARALVEQLTVRLDEALHPAALFVPILDPHRAALRSPDGRCRALELSSRLADLLKVGRAPLDVTPSDPTSAFSALDQDGQAWVVDQRIVLVVPMYRTTGDVIGAIALGEKKSELPYSGEDLDLLTRLAAASGQIVEVRILKDSSGLGAASSLAEAFAHDPARLCPGCERVYPPTTSSCPGCGKDLTDTILPYQLAGKFRLERRVGKGGMGVVFRARDMTLHRSVAIKTVPTGSAEASVRLRQEAQAVARFSHTNLATIYGVETWRGTFGLVFEFLEGGTLADRLKVGPLACAEAVDLGIAIASALEHIHVRGMLHRDVKPTNIGFTAGGVPQLMDFGLAWSATSSSGQRLMAWADPGTILDDDELTRSEAGSESALSFLRAVTPGLAGTPLYYSPEYVRTGRPSAASDLWALAMVLYVSIAGVHPFAGQPSILLENISHAQIPRIDTLIPECPRAMVQFLVATLAVDGSQRASATHFRDRLERVRDSLIAGAVESVGSSASHTH